MYIIYMGAQGSGLRTTKFSGRPSFRMHASKFRNVDGVHRRPAMGSGGVWILIVLGPCNLVDGIICNIIMC